MKHKFCKKLNAAVHGENYSLSLNAYAIQASFPVKLFALLKLQIFPICNRTVCGWMSIGNHLRRRADCGVQRWSVCRSH